MNKKENRRRINELFMDGIKVLIQKEKSDMSNNEKGKNMIDDHYKDKNDELHDKAHEIAADSIENIDNARKESNKEEERRRIMNKEPIMNQKEEERRRRIIEEMKKRKEILWKNYPLFPI